MAKASVAPAGANVFCWGTLPTATPTSVGWPWATLCRRCRGWSVFFWRAQRQFHLATKAGRDRSCRELCHNALNDPHQVSGLMLFAQASVKTALKLKEPSRRFTLALACCCLGIDFAYPD